MFKKPLLMLALTTTVLSTGAVLAGQAEQHLDTSVNAAKQLELDASWADIVLTATRGDKITVKADLRVEATGSDASAQECLDGSRVGIETHDDRVVIRQGKKRGFSGCSGFGTRKTTGKIEVGVPAGIPVRLGTASGDVRIDGDFGDIALAAATASGELKLVGQARELELSTASGDIAVDVPKPVAKLKVSTASGDVELKGGADQARVETASGNINLAGLRGSLEVEAASGDITASWGRFPADTKVRIDTASGNVTLNLPNGTRPSGELSVHSGDIRADVEGISKSDRRNVQLSGSDGRIDVGTASGDITLRRGE